VRRASFLISDSVSINGSTSSTREERPHVRKKLRASGGVREKTGGVRKVQSIGK